MKRFVEVNDGIERLKSTLANSRISASNNALYQTIFELINKLKDVNTDTNARIDTISSGSGGGGGGGGGSVTGSETFLTTGNETATLPNSRELLAGLGIAFDDTVANQRTISATSAVDHVVMSDGGIPNAQPLNNGAGQFIYTAYVP